MMPYDVMHTYYNSGKENYFLVIGLDDDYIFIFIHFYSLGIFPFLNLF